MALNGNGYISECSQQLNYVKGARHYELSNHLGNVLSVVSDRKIEVDESYTFQAGGGYIYQNGAYTTDPLGNYFQNNPADGIIDGYVAEVISATDYYAFGAPLAGRTYQASEYRFGFNGQEKDDEVSGVGNTMTAEFWEYDSRLGRRWNLDPIVKSHESPFACFSNNPIWIIDPNGADSVKVGGDWKWKLGPKEDYNTVSSKTGVKKDDLRLYTQIPDKHLKEGYLVALSSPELKAGDRIRIVNENYIIGFLNVIGFNIGTESAYLSLEFEDVKTGYATFNYAQTMNRNITNAKRPDGSSVSYPLADPENNNGLYLNSGNITSFKYMQDGPTVISGYWMYLETSLVGRNENNPYRPIISVKYYVTENGYSNGLRLNSNPSKFHLRQIKNAKESMRW